MEGKNKLIIWVNLQKETTTCRAKNYKSRNIKLKRKQKQDAIEKSKKENDELEGKSFGKPKIDVECLTCEERSRIDSDQGYHCQNCDFIVTKQKHQFI